MDGMNERFEVYIWILCGITELQSLKWASYKKIQYMKSHEWSYLFLY